MTVIPPYPIFLVRHGETEWNREDRRQGQGDSPLTEKGAGQVQAIGRGIARLIAGQADWRLVASPLGRTRQTAAIVSAACGLPVAFDDRLMEAGFGIWEGLTWPEIDVQRPGASADPYVHFHTPGGETYDQVAARATDWLSSVRQPTIAVSHGVFGRVLRTLYLSRPESAYVDQPAATQQDAFYRLEDGKVTSIDCSMEMAGG